MLKYVKHLGFYHYIFLFPHRTGTIVELKKAQERAPRIIKSVEFLL